MFKLHRLVRNGMFAFFLCLSAPVLANDLIIENFSVSLIHNGSAVSVNDLPYLVDSDTLDVAINTEVSWYCKNYTFPIGCEEAKPDFTARLELHASNTIGSYDDTLTVRNSIIFDGDNNVQYRGETNTNETRNSQTTNLQNIAGFNDIVSEARYYADTLVWRLVINTGSLITYPVVSETDAGADLNNTAEVDPLKLWPLSGVFNIGSNTRTSITQAISLVEYSPCGTTSGSTGLLTNLAVYADVEWQTSTSGNWGNVNFTDNMCATFDYVGPVGDKSLTLTALYDISIGDVSGSLGGMPVTLSDVVLQETSDFTYGGLTVSLPAGMSVHIRDNDEGGPKALGQSEVVLGNITLSDVNDLDTLQASKTTGGGGGFIHSETLPFSLSYSVLSLSSATGLTGEYIDIIYPYDRPYASSDGRHMSRNGPVSNDRRYSNPAAPSVTSKVFEITASGLQVAEVKFDAPGTSPTHFPRANAVINTPFSVGVSDGYLNQNHAAIDIASYDFDFYAGCKLCSGVSHEINYSMSALSDELVSSDGSVAAEVSIGRRYIDWGTYSAVSSAYMYSHDLGSFATGFMYLPGHIATGTGQSDSLKVSDSLMGSRQLSLALSDFIPGNHFSLNSKTAQRGNYAMPGVTIGPDLYSFGPSKIISAGSGNNLAGTSITIGLGGLPNPDFTLISNNEGTKYVLRRGGLTGVFNSTTSFAAKSSATVYGYNLNFAKFAFRQENNKIDSYSWIDGDFHIPGKGEFDVVFESLGLECSGDIAGGLIAYEGRPGTAQCSDGDNNGNGYDDENCVESFIAWNADIELLSLQFVDIDPALQSCAAQDRILQLGNTITMHALERDLGMRAEWSAQGEPGDATVTGVTDHVMDTPKGIGVPSTEKQGFKVALRSGLELRTPTTAGVENNSDTDGWLALTADVSLPFWESLDVSARIANSITVDGEQEQSIITQRGGSLSGTTPTDNAEISNAGLAAFLENGTSSNFKAKYQWGSTAFGFDLPVYYAAGHATGNEADRKKPMFLGRTLNIPLAVLDANAGINFVTPKKTQISFGASADFSRIPRFGDEFALHIDFNDPDSIKKVDEFLCGFPVGCSSTPSQRPIAKVFNTLNDQFTLIDEFDVLNQVVGAGLDSFLEEGVESALDNIAVNQLLDEISDALGSVHALPDRLGSSTSALSDIADDMISPLRSDTDSAPGAEMDRLMVELYEQLPAVLYQAQVSGPTGLESQLAGHLIRLDVVITALSKARASSDTVKRRIAIVKQDITAVLDGVTNVATGEISEVLAAIDGLDTQLTNIGASGGALGSCSFDVADPAASGNNLLGEIAGVHKKITSVESALKLLDILELGSLVTDIAGVELEALTSANREIVSRIADLNETFNNVKDSIEDLCGTSGPATLATELQQIVNGAKGLLANVRAKVVLVDAAVTEIRVTVLEDVVNPDNPLLVKLDNTVTAINTQLDGVISVLQTMRDTVVAASDASITEYDFDIRAISAGDVNIIQAKLDALMREFVGEMFSWYYPAVGSGIETSIVGALAVTIRQTIDQSIASIAQVAHGQLSALVNVVPKPSSEELRAMLVSSIMNSTAIETVDIAVNNQLSRLHRPMTNVIVSAADQINYVLQELAQALEGKAKEALALATAEVPNMPVGSGSLDGYGLIAGNELERLHLAAEWDINSDSSDSGSAFNASLDLINVSAESQGEGCGVGSQKGTLTAIIESTQLPITIGASDARIRQLILGFSLSTSGSTYTPVGLFGGIALDGELGFDSFTLFDLAFASGVGTQQAYLGASAGARFDALQFESAFLVGKTCNGGVLTMLDPEALIDDPDGPFSGVYARGAATVPIYRNGCGLTVTVGADVGSWFLTGPPLQYGGLIGGSATGKVACIASLRGQVLTLGEMIGDQFRFYGEGFGVGGIGLDCDPGDWTSVPRSRKDDWCGTGDARFELEYKDGWVLGTPKASAVH